MSKRGETSVCAGRYWWIELRVFDQFVLDQLHQDGLRNSPKACHFHDETIVEFRGLVNHLSRQSLCGFPIRLLVSNTKRKEHCARCKKKHSGVSTRVPCGCCLSQSILCCCVSMELTRRSRQPFVPSGLPRWSKQMWERTSRRESLTLPKECRLSWW